MSLQQATHVGEQKQIEVKNTGKTVKNVMMIIFFAVVPLIISLPLILAYHFITDKYTDISGDE